MSELNLDQLQSLDEPQPTLVEHWDKAKNQDKTTAFLWSLPQPFLVFGSMIMVSSAFVTEWMDPRLLAAIMLIAPLPLILIAERIWTRRSDWELTPKEFFEDAFWLACGYFLWMPLFDDYYESPISDAFTWVRETTAFPFTLAPESIVGIILAAILVKAAVEFIYYWLHRLQHVSLFCWRIHATHHHITKMGAARADRTHPLEYIALSLGAPIVLAISNASDAVIATTAAFGFWNGYMNHANLPLRSGFYGWIFGTAEMHQLHHSRDLASSRSNYGGNIIIWDRLFGTFSGSTDIEAIGAGTGKPLDIWTQYKMAFVSDDELENY
tara:strand:- start:911 stop:1885 length:975 start_codon:yes stop_codon:yes gene_type:complete